MEEYVCLTCWHRFERRKEEVGYRACALCHSRTVVDFETVVKAVKGAWEWIDAHKPIFKQTKYGFLDAPFILFRDLPLIKKILLHTYFPLGIESFARIVKMALEYDPNKGRIEEHVRKYLK
ncbi:MAG: hypothetical protein QME47_03965 [Candidatus Thermoplasmatota archaeon]|nr:hypothetical protein [Candidatus Thermoplasmatota archaeon]